MSLILEALKKSEARRQLGEAPGIGTPFTVAKRRRNALPMIMILIVVAAGFGWYYLHTMQAASAPAAAGSSTAPMRGVAPPSRLRAAPAAPMAAARRRPPANPQGAPAERAKRENPPQPQIAAPAAPAKPANPANVQAVRPPSAAQMAGLLEGRRQRRETAAGAAPGDTVNRASAPNRPTAVAPDTARQPAGQGPQAATPAARPAPAKPAVGTSIAPDLPLYYELPYNVRKDLPDLTISVHVYSAVPAQRFVIIDGERRVEGDTVQDGLTLHEIRPDGIVLEFRGQKFFYPRQGR